MITTIEYAINEKPEIKCGNKVKVLGFKHKLTTLTITKFRRVKHNDGYYLVKLWVKE